ERRQLPSRPLQAPLTPTSIRRFPRRHTSGLNCESKKAPDIGGLLAAAAMDCCSGRRCKFSPALTHNPVRTVPRLQAFPLGGKPACGSFQLGERPKSAIVVNSSGADLGCEINNG